MAAFPMVFFGHGSPTVAIEDSETTRSWARIAAGLGRPQAILAISAHWLTRGTAVTAMPAPRTIYDFGGFPELRQVQYPAPGDPALARRVAELLAPAQVMLDDGQWGFDHGTWSVLVHAFRGADIPVVQLSLDVGLTPAQRLEFGRRLSALRDEGVLIMGTGNIVHNLQLMDWRERYGAPHPWAGRFHDHIRAAIEQDRPDDVAGYQALGQDAALSQPTPDHYWPLLYVLGARRPSDRVEIGPDHIEYRSISMLTAVFDSRPAAAAAA